MAEELTWLNDALLNWKQIFYAYAGYFIRALWYYKPPFNWMKFIAGGIFLVLILGIMNNYVNKDYHLVVGALAGMWANNIITGIFEVGYKGKDAMVKKVKKYVE